MSPARCHIPSSASVAPIRRRFGQNFLTDQNALRRIAGALDLRGSETVIEIGPGRGALTAHLAGTCRRLICIEIDRDLVRTLREQYGGRDDVEIVEGDVLELSLGQVAGGDYALVGNVPYYITTPIIFHALRAPLPLRAVFLVQREVAERLAAEPGTDAYGALTVNVALSARVENVGAVGAGSFFPRPKVESAIVRLAPHASPVVPPGDAEALRRFVIALFGQRRRQLVRAIRTVTDCSAQDARRLVTGAAIDPGVRAEVLSPEEFARLYGAVRDAGLAGPNESGSTTRS